MPVITEAELAKVLKRDPMAIRKAVRDGRVTPRADGMFDQDAAVQEWMDTTHHEKGHNNKLHQLPDLPTPEIPLPNETKSTAYAKARAGTQIYEALLKKLRYEERAKNLTPTADVESARFTEFRTLREACFNIPSRISALLAGENDPAKCQQMLEGELTSVFQAFSEGKLAA